MRLEHIQYFVEVANVGSISLAAKNLYISQQGVSNALHQLEQEVGFPLFTRQKRGVTVTNNGKKFYLYAVNFLDKYDEMVSFSNAVAAQYGNKVEEIFLMATPLIINLLAGILYDREIRPKYLSGIKLYEGDLQRIVAGLTNNKIHLGVFFIQKELFAKFRAGIPSEIELIELFEDKPCVAVSLASPLAAYQTVDINAVSNLKIAHSTSYYEYFDQSEMILPDIYSNDISLHIKLIKEQQAVSVLTYKAYQYSYMDSEIVARSLESPSCGKYYLARNTNRINQGIVDWIKYIVDHTCML